MAGNNSALDYLFQLSTGQAELSAVVKAHEEAINDMEDRVDTLVARPAALSEERIREIIQAAVKEQVDKLREAWWVPIVKTAAATILATTVLAAFAYFAAHVHWR